MKKSAFILSLILSASFIPFGAVDAHEETNTAPQYIGDKLPQHREFTNLTEHPKTEKTADSTNSSSTTDQGTQKVTVLAVADEEYKAAYPDWQSRIQSIVEKADDAFNRDHNIDFEVKGLGEWGSSGQNSEQILADLSKDWDGQGYDFVIGFTRDANFDAGGIGYVYNSEPFGSAISVNLDQGTANTAKATQHELSHNFGLGHDPQGSGIKCIMNYDYAYSVDYWDPEHNETIEKNKIWYGN